MVKKHKAVGHHGVNANVDQDGIERVLADRGEQRIGYGRLVETVGSLDEIEDKLTRGWEILWCQMSKTISTGETDEG